MSVVSAAIIAAALAVTAGATGRLEAAVSTCATPHLVVWLDTTANGTAGSVYYHLEFTNLSGHMCNLQGFPGVSAVTLVGKRIGNPASRSTTKLRIVRLGQGETASVVLRVVDTGNYSDSRCRPAIAAGLRVYPPGDTVSKVISFAFRTCRRTGVSVLAVSAVRSGAR